MEEMVEMYPCYQVVIRKNETGEVKIVDMKVPWYGHTMYWWTQGNMSCDCNRMAVFGDEPMEGDMEPADPENPNKGGFISYICGNTRYRVLIAIFPDGKATLIDLEDAEVPR